MYQFCKPPSNPNYAGKGNFLLILAAFYFSHLIYVFKKRGKKFRKNKK